MLAAVLASTQTASAGDGGMPGASAQAAFVDVMSDDPAIDLDNDPQPLAVGPDDGQQTLPGTVDVSSGDSSLVATSTVDAVGRSDTGLEASSTLDGVTLTLLGETVARAQAVTASVTCAFSPPTTQAQAQTTGLQLGDAPPVDLVTGQSSTASITIDGTAGATYDVRLQASVIGEGQAAFGQATGLLILVVIDGTVIGNVTLATATCQLPQAGPDDEQPGPVRPEDGLADSGTDTAVVAALLGIVLVAGGGSALLWARGTTLHTSGRHCR
ncbi:MAG: hypothetical protein ACRDZ2_12495 [Ilumatobacteraceae bacterium]